MERFDIYWADIPFEENSSNKTRPALVITEIGEQIMFLKITTKGTAAEYHLPITEWKKAGLKEPSYISYQPFYRIEKSKVGEKIGRLQQIDIFMLENYLTTGRKK